MNIISKQNLSLVFAAGSILIWLAVFSALGGKLVSAAPGTPTPPTNTTQTTTTTTGTTTAAPPTDKPLNGDKGGFVPCGNSAGNPCQIGHLFSAFVVIVNYLIGMAGFIAVLAIVYAGFMMVYSQGQENLKAAKGRFSGAIIGLVLIAAAFVLINTLFSGSLSIGIQNGANVLANPLEYIQTSNQGK